MDDTASSFSTRSNAKRAAEQMIAKGTAPAVDYGIKPRDDGRFEIVWKAAAAAPISGEVEAEIAEAGIAADKPLAGGPALEDGHYSANPHLSINSDPSYTAPAATTTDEEAGFDPAAEAREVHDAWQAERAAPNAATADEAGTEPQPGAAASSASEPEPDPFPAGTYVKVRTGKRKTHTGHISHRIDEQHWRVRLLGAADGVTELASAAQLYRAEGEAPAPEEKKPANRQRRGGATGPQKASRSRYTIDPKAIASGKLPATAPVVTSAANPHYQKRFDELHKLAAASDWAAVRDYKVTGSNSYSKLVARYQQDLLALHAAWEAAQ
jgi:hypothetical protein